MLPITAPLFDDEEVALVKQVLDSGWVTQGPFTARFEMLFAARHGVPHALATTSCTAALHLATLALGLQPGDEVVVPAFTWVTSAHAAEYVGAKAVFTDISLDTFNIDPAALASAITSRTRAIVAVHLFGKAAPMSDILAMAARHQLVVIEDAACAVGTTYQGTPVGGMADVGCFSFHPRKVITTGEGGMITTRQPELASRVKALRNHGATGLAFGAEPDKPWTMATFKMLGYNLRLSDIQAAVGIAQMAKLDRLLAERRRLALRYTAQLGDVSGIITPHDDDGHTYQSYVIRTRESGVSRRNALMERLSAADIQTRPGTHAVHRLGYYADKYGLTPDQFPNAATAEETTITLPIFPGMTDEHQDRVIAVLESAFAR